MSLDFLLLFGSIPFFLFLFACVMIPPPFYLTRLICYNVLSPIFLPLS